MHRSNVMIICHCILAEVHTLGLLMCKTLNVLKYNHTTVFHSGFAIDVKMIKILISCLLTVCVSYIVYAQESGGFCCHGSISDGEVGDVSVVDCKFSEGYACFRMEDQIPITDQANLSAVIMKCTKLPNRIDNQRGQNASEENNFSKYCQTDNCNCRP